MNVGNARKLKLEDGKVKVEFLTAAEKKKIKKIFKNEVRIFSSKRGIFIKPVTRRPSRPIESIALDMGEELKISLDVPLGTSFASCFAPQNWPSVPATAR